MRAFFSECVSVIQSVCQLFHGPTPRCARARAHSSAPGTGVKTSFHLIHSRSVTMADAGPVPDANSIDMAVSTPGKDASDPDKTTARKALFQSTPKAPDKTENVSTPSTGKKRNTRENNIVIPRGCATLRYLTREIGPVDSHGDRFDISLERSVIGWETHA